MKLNQEIILEI